MAKQIEQMYKFTMVNLVDIGDGPREVIAESGDTKIEG
jgi:hypothetical protein